MSLILREDRDPHRSADPQFIEGPFVRAARRAAPFGRSFPREARIQRDCR
jgi:hypothetical protein